MSNSFEYEGLLVTYNAEVDAYQLISIGYDYVVGWACVKEGPGAVIEFGEYRDWMDLGTTLTVANFLSDLNETIKE